jgi:hypothetical protein
MPLVTILNSNPQVFDHRMKLNESELMRALTRWVIRDPPFPLNLQSSSHGLSENDIDCSQKRYSLVFTGKRLSQPRIIVDFVPFGYDVGMISNAIFSFSSLNSPRQA